MSNTKKITLATFKAFIRKAGDNLHVMRKSTFDGMQDMVVACKTPFAKARIANLATSNNCGIEGVWVVGGGRNFFEAYNQDGFSGIEVYNCCGSFVVAVPAA